MTNVAPIAELLRKHRDEICLLVERNRATNPRVFGSVARGTEHSGSDLDLLVEPCADTSLFDLGGLQMDLEELLGVKVDLLTPRCLPPRFRTQILKEAVPL